MKTLRFPFQGTVSYPSDAKKVDTEKLLQKARDLYDGRLQELAAAFTGIRVIVDPKLDGLNYYMCVSPTLFKKLEQQLKKAPAAAPNGQKVKKDHDGVSRNDSDAAGRDRGHAQ